MIGQASIVSNAGSQTKNGGRHVLSSWGTVGVMTCVYVCECDRGRISTARTRPTLMNRYMTAQKAKRKTTACTQYSVVHLPTRLWSGYECGSGAGQRSRRHATLRWLVSQHAAGRGAHAALKEYVRRLLLSMPCSLERTPHPISHTGSCRPRQ